MDKTIKQIIRENNANGVKDIVWNEEKKQWVVTWLGKGLTPDYFNSFADIIDALKPEPGH